MRKLFRSPIIAALVLLLTIFLLPNVEAARRGIKQTAPGNAASNHKAVSGGRFMIASLLPQEEEIFADLSVTKVVDSEEAIPGTNLTYTITVHNAESFAVENATLDDPLPAGLEFVSLAKPNAWTCTTPLVGEGGTVNCTNPSLAANANDVFTLVVKVPLQASPGTAYTNVATVSSTIPESNEENNSASATSTVASQNTDITVTKLADAEKVTAGENITYTITVQNSSSFEADNVTLDDALPAGTTFVSLTKPATWTCTTPTVDTNGSINCTTPNLAPNSNDVFTLVVKTDENSSAGTSFTNMAVVGTSTPESNEENNDSSATTTILSADLDVSKVDTPDPTSAGTNLTYTIIVQNIGPDTAANPSLNDTLPAGTTFVSLSAPSGWLCSKPAVGASGSISCTADSLGIESAAFTLVVKVDSGVSAGTILTNTATAASTTADPLSLNNSGTATTTVAELRGWSTTANSSVTEDESNPARPVYTNFTAAVSPASPVGAYTLRYNIQAMDGLAGAGANTRLRVRFRDDGAGSRVTVAIMRSAVTGGVATLGTIFDSDDYTPGSGFQTQEILMPAITFDFTQNFYWLEVVMTKSEAANQPGFGSAQINRQ